MYLLLALGIFFVGVLGPVFVSGHCNICDRYDDLIIKRMDISEEMEEVVLGVYLVDIDNGRQYEVISGRIREKIVDKGYGEHWVAMVGAAGLDFSTYSYLAQPHSILWAEYGKSQLFLYKSADDRDVTCPPAPTCPPQPTCPPDTFDEETWIRRARVAPRWHEEARNAISNSVARTAVDKFKYYLSRDLKFADIADHINREIHRKYWISDYSVYVGAKGHFRFHLPKYVAKTTQLARLLKRRDNDVNKTTSDDVMPPGCFSRPFLYGYIDQVELVVFF